MTNLLIFIGAFLLLMILSRIITKSLSRFFMRLTGSIKTTIQMLQIIFLPGIIIHELAHMLTAGLLFVKSGGIEFNPEINDNGEVKMASVRIAKTDPIRRAIIGVAPVIIGMVLISLTFVFFLSGKPLSPEYLNYILSFVIVFEIGNTMFSSKKDMEGTLALISFIILLGIIFYILNINLPFNPMDILSSDYSQTLLKNGTIFLLAPIGVDLVFYLLYIFFLERS